MQRLWSIGDSQHGNLNKIALLNMLTSIDSFDGDKIIGDGCIGPACGIHLQNLGFGLPIMNLSLATELNAQLRKQVSDSRDSATQSNIKSALADQSDNALILMNLGTIQRMNRELKGMVTDTKDAYALNTISQYQDQLAATTTTTTTTTTTPSSLMVLLDAGDVWGKQLAGSIISDIRLV